MKTSAITTVDEYFAALPEEIRGQLAKLRKAVKEAAPRAEEVISYGMPAIRQNGILVYYAAAKHHIGFYPTSAPIKVFKDDLVNYQTSKGAIQFPYDKPVPITLVKKIVKYRVLEDQEKAKAKQAKKK